MPPPYTEYDRHGHRLHVWRLRDRLERRGYRLINTQRRNVLTGEPGRYTILDGLEEAIATDLDIDQVEQWVSDR